MDITATFLSYVKHNHSTEVLSQNQIKKIHKLCTNDNWVSTAMTNCKLEEHGPDYVGSTSRHATIAAKN